MAPSAEASSDPIDHVRRLRGQIEQLQGHLRGDIARVEEPQFRALCETAAEVLAGLQTAFAHYEQGTEPAWSGRRQAPQQGVVKDLRGQEQPRDAEAAKLR